MTAAKEPDCDLRAAIVEPVGGHGGMNYYDFGLASGLSAAGVPATVYTCDETAVPAGTPFRVETSFRRIYGADPKPLRFARFARGLARSLRTARARREGTAHFHFFHATALEALCVGLARLGGFVVVATAHDVESFVGRTSQRLAARVYRGAHRVIAHNEVIRRELGDKAGVPREKIALVPHGNYPEALDCRLDARTARARLGLPAEGPILLFFGQIKEAKGLDLLLAALPRVAETHPAVRLVVAGKVWKDDLGRYEAQIREAGIADRVDLRIRYVPDAEVADYYRAADLAVLPYRRIYQSGVLLMALSYGTPVLASDLAGMAEIVRDGENGFLFRTGDAGHLATRLQELLGSPDALAAAGAAGREHVRREHDWNAVGRLTRAAYQAAGSAC